MIRKRILKEINTHLTGDYITTKTKIWTKEPLYSLYYDHDENTISFMSLIDDYLLCKITISINDNYPFSPPQTINIKNTQYKNILNNVSDNILDTYKNYIYINHVKCDCFSILSNWNPSYGFSNILDEINSKLILYKKITYMIYAKKIMQNKLGFIIPSIFTFF